MLGDDIEVELAAAVEVGVTACGVPNVVGAAKLVVNWLDPSGDMGYPCCVAKNVL